MKSLTCVVRSTPAFLKISATTGVYTFKDVCPGTDACDKNMDIDPLLVPNVDYAVCL